MASFTAQRQFNRSLNRNGQRRGMISPTVIFGGVFLVIVGMYVAVVAWFSVATSSPLRQTQAVDMPTAPAKGGGGGAAGVHHGYNRNNNNNNMGNFDAVKTDSNALDELKKAVKQQDRHPIVRNFKAKPKGEGIKPMALLSDAKENTEPEPARETHPDPDHIMKAFVEPIKFDDWEVKPLPVRTTARKEQLKEIKFSKVNSCSKLPERWSADEYPDQDTFLPWIHDVFPTDDGKFIQFVAQNRRRCHTGTTDSEIEILFKTQPSVALFQHVPVKRVIEDGDKRYKLSTHDEADPDGIATRFICRFKPTMEETLSVFNFDYDWAAHRKKQKHTFKFDDGGIKSVHTSQLIFQCPVPEGLQEKIRSGESVVNDFATLFVDVIPIRTPPRYGIPNKFLQPRYNQSLVINVEDRFDPKKEWGDDHILPKIEDSGRWENIPICKPSVQQFYNSESKEISLRGGGDSRNGPQKKHRLVSCLWASAGYSTRGNRFAINDGQRRLLEWVHFNKMLGFEHFYLYDNSYAFSNDVTLKPVADLFPDEITYIKWPFQVCNNNPNNVDSPGERSSQYAAEASCRLRFGPHVDWIGQFDIDEYLVPMGSYTSILPLLDKLDGEGKKIVSFGSWRAWPRRDFIEEPVPIKDKEQCGRSIECFELQVPLKNTMLQSYNCDRQAGPKKKVMPAEKQIYKPEYVKQHFIHYSSVTALSVLSQAEFEAAGYDWKRTRAFPDPNSRFGDELNEATMLHTKAVARQDTVGWQQACMDKYKGGFMCRIGVPFPENYDEKVHGTGDEKGWAYNCYPNKKIDDYWAPLLQKAINENHGGLFEKS